MNNLLKKGDVVKTSLSDSTLVLKVEKDGALLFDGRKFIVAQGVQKENDKVFWNQGSYYDELDDVFNKKIMDRLEDHKNQIEDDWELER